MTREELQREFKTLRNQAIYLIQTFNTYNDLFEAGDEVERVLRKSAERFFGDISVIMIEYMILLVCRLTDPPGTSGRANLTIPYMNKLLRENDCFNSEIETLSDSIMDYRELLEPVRNKIVAHMDHDTYIQDLALGGHSKEEMKQFFKNDLLQYFEKVAKAISVTPLGSLITRGYGDALDLRKTLSRGLIAEKLIREEPKMALYFLENRHIFNHDKDS